MQVTSSHTPRNVPGVQNAIISSQNGLSINLPIQTYCNPRLKIYIPAHHKRRRKSWLPLWSTGLKNQRRSFLRGLFMSYLLRPSVKTIILSLSPKVQEWRTCSSTPYRLMFAFQAIKQSVQTLKNFSKEYRPQLLKASETAVQNSQLQLTSGQPKASFTHSVAWLHSGSIRIGSCMRRCLSLFHFMDGMEVQNVVSCCLGHSSTVVCPRISLQAVQIMLQAMLSWTVPYASASIRHILRNVHYVQKIYSLAVGPMQSISLFSELIHFIDMLNN